MTEKEIRKAILRKVKPRIRDKRARHWIGFVYINETFVAKGSSKNNCHFSLGLSPPLVVAHWLNTPGIRPLRASMDGKIPARNCNTYFWTNPKVKIPNDHAKERGESKVKRIRDSLFLGKLEFAKLIACPMKKRRFYELFAERTFR